jgi:hypothetical protein
MKRLVLVASLTALSLAFGVARADEILSGTPMPGNFPEVQQGVSQWRVDPNRSAFAGIQNPGTFAPVPQSGLAQGPHEPNPSGFSSALTNPGNFAPAPLVTHNYNDATPVVPSVAQGSKASGS